MLLFFLIMYIDAIISKQLFLLTIKINNEYRGSKDY